MAKLIFLNKGFKGKEYQLMVEKTTVGRKEDNTLVIHDNSVSSHHCELLVSGPEFIVRELQSTNGTFVDGKKVPGQSQVKHGQVIRFGEVEARVDLDVIDPRRDDTEVTTVYTLDEIERQKRRTDKKKEGKQTHEEMGDASNDASDTLIIRKEDLHKEQGNQPQAPAEMKVREPKYIIPEPKATSNPWFIVGMAAVVILIAFIIYLLSR